MVHLEDEPNAGKAWTSSEIDALKRLASQQIPTRTIAERLGRSEYSVRAKASHEHIQLRSAKHHQRSHQPR
jgi:hypothetical protein